MNKASNRHGDKTYLERVQREIHFQSREKLGAGDPHDAIDRGHLDIGRNKTVRDISQRIGQKDMLHSNAGKVLIPCPGGRVAESGPPFPALNDGTSDWAECSRWSGSVHCFAILAQIANKWVQGIDLGEQTHNWVLGDRR